MQWKVTEALDRAVWCNIKVITSMLRKTSLLIFFAWIWTVIVQWGNMSFNLILPLISSTVWVKGSHAWLQISRYTCTYCDLWKLSTISTVPHRPNWCEVSRKLLLQLVIWLKGKNIKVNLF